MIDTRTLEVILSEQKEELEARAQETLCHRPEEALVEINSPQAHGADDIGMEEKTKYAKAMHDFLGDKNKAIMSKFEIAKFMGELIKHSGDIDSTLNDQSFAKRSTLDLAGLRAEIDKLNEEDTETYTLKNG